MSYAASGTGDLEKLKGYKSPTWRLRGDCFRALHQLRGSAIIVAEISDRHDANSPSCAAIESRLPDSSLFAGSRSPAAVNSAATICLHQPSPSYGQSQEA